MKTGKSLSPDNRESAIQNREQFESMLASALEEVGKLEIAQPTYPVWGLIKRHLERMREATRDGHYPSRKEQDACLPGTIAMRELEPATDVRIYHLTQHLHELQYYFQVQLHPPSLWERIWAKHWKTFQLINHFIEIGILTLKPGTRE